MRAYDTPQISRLKELVDSDSQLPGEERSAIENAVSALEGELKCSVNDAGSADLSGTLETASDNESAAVKATEASISFNAPAVSNPGSAVNASSSEDFVRSGDVIGDIAGRQFRTLDAQRPAQPPHADSSEPFETGSQGSPPLSSGFTSGSDSFQQSPSLSAGPASPNVVDIRDERCYLMTWILVNS